VFATRIAIFVCLASLCVTSQAWGQSSSARQGTFGHKPLSVPKTLPGNSNNQFQVDSNDWKMPIKISGSGWSPLGRKLDESIGPIHQTEYAPERIASQDTNLGQRVTPLLTTPHTSPPAEVYQPDQVFTDSECPDCAVETPLLHFGDSRFRVTWLPGDGNSLGITDIDGQMKITVPRVPGLVLTPGIGTHYLNGPSRTDLPAKLYDAFIEFKYMKQVTPQIGYELAITPGVFSDYEQSNSDAFRLPGRALAFYGQSAEKQFVAGIAYLDREDVKLLPVFGMIYTPSEAVRYELIFPRPRLAARYLQTDTLDRWMYLSGEFGGGSWAVERVSGAKDVATISDWRLITGIETRYFSGIVTNFEFAIVFNREVEYKSKAGDYDPDSTAMLRYGVTF